MKFRNLWWIGLLAITLSYPAFAQQDNPELPEPSYALPGQVASLKIKKLFIPGGFDDNDSVEVIAWTQLPNPCWVLDGGRFIMNDADPTNPVLNVFVTAHKKNGVGLCPQVLVDIIEVIKIGKLEDKTYKVIASGEVGVLERGLTIKASDPNLPIDSHLYAPVDNVTLKDTENGMIQVSLTGRFPVLDTLQCFDFDEVKHEFDSQNVLAVLPIISPKNQVECESSPFRDENRNFTYQFEVKKHLESPFLVHVRTLGGHSINKFVDSR